MIVYKNGLNRKRCIGACYRAFPRCSMVWPVFLSEIRRPKLDIASLPVLTFCFRLQVVVFRKEWMFYSRMLAIRCAN